MTTANTLKEVDTLKLIVYEKNSPTLHVGYLYKQNYKLAYEEIDVPFDSVDFSELLNLIAERLSIKTKILTIEDIEKCTYQGANPEIELGRRMCIDLVGQKLGTKFMLIEPHTKITDNVEEIVSPCCFTDEEIGTFDAHGNVVLPGIINKTGYMLTLVINELINKPEASPVPNPAV